MSGEVTPLYWTAPEIKWSMTLAFGRSKSENYDRAVFLARQAPEYIESGGVVQATFSESPKEFLILSHLFDLIKDWKSLYIAVRGEHADIRLAEKIIWCYGENCRSGCLDYCYGNDTLTENPFGCHRLNIVTYSRPWWTFGFMDDNRVWHVNIDLILERVKKFAETYYICPAFSKSKIISGIFSLPQVIDPKTDDHWAYDSHHWVIPSSKVPWRK